MKVLVLVALCFASSIVTASAQTCDRSPLLVKHVDVWSPSKVDRNRDVLVVDGRIQRVARAGRVQSPPGARVIDGEGALMLPGLIDAHVHFGFPGARIDKPNRHVWGDAAVTGAQLLRSGVTSARQHLDNLSRAHVLHDAAKDDCAALPRLQVGGPAFIPGSPTHDRSAVWSAESVDDAIAKVQRQRELGFEWVAIHEAHALPDDQRAAIVHTARRLGMRILASGYSMPEVASSLELQPDTIDYLDVSATPEYAGALLEKARAQRQLVWVARLGVHERYRAQQETPALIDAPLNYDLMEPDAAEVLRASVRKDAAHRESEHAQRMVAAYPTLRRKFEQLRATGIPLAMGTDVGSPGHFHRDAIWWEINAWVKNGATVNEALIAATVNGAKVLNDPALGHLREGAKADFVLYRGELEPGELSAMNVALVVKGGVVHFDR